MNIDTYIYGTSFYHRFDIRAKLLFTLIYCTCIFFIHSWHGLLFSVLVPLALFLVSLGKRETIRAVRKILPVLILLFLFLPLQDRLSEPVLSIKSVAIVTEDGLYRVFRLASRFTSLSLTLMLLIATERSERIISGLRYYHLPYKVALLFSLVSQTDRREARDPDYAINNCFCCLRCENDSRYGSSP